MRATLLVLLFLLVQGCQTDTQKETAAERPNIIFIFTDDHSADALSAYGSTINSTPNMDRIANEGMRFDRCFVTNSICAPSRATILTGKHSHLNGQLTNGERFDGTQQTFPKLLQSAGYQTAMIGKWHLRSAPTGFDHYRVLIGQGPYYNPPMRGVRDTVVMEGYTTDIITDLAMKWLDEGRDKEKPFMLMYQHKAPHRNWQPGPDHLNTFDDVEIPEPRTLHDDYAGRSSAARSANMRIETNLTAYDLKIAPPRNFTPEQLEAWNAAYGPKNEEARGLTGEALNKWKFQRYMKDYLRSVQSVDDNIGRLLAYLDETGLAENTVVIYNSDQGWYLGEHGWYDKRWMYEPSLRTPLLVRWPGVTPAGSENGDMVSNLDLAATFLDIAGVDVPGDMQGKSLKPIFQGETPENWRKTHYYHYYEHPGAHCVQRHYGVRSDRYKLIYFYSIDEWEFYDLEADPDEMNNAYADPANAELIAEMKEELDRLRVEYEVPEDTRPTGDCSYDAEGWSGYE